MIIGFMNGISFLLFFGDNKKSNKTGWGGRIRTCECRLQKPMPYRLATPQENDPIQYLHEISQISSKCV